jgi:YfiH family protein
MIEPAAMAERTVSGGAVPMVEVPGWREEFGVVAGLTTRGTPGQEFDLGLASEEPTRVVLDRWHRVHDAFPGFEGVVVGRQVHGTNLVWHERARGWSVFHGVDGHATQRPGILLAVSVADCVPIYFVDPVRRAAALLHSGWRGTSAGIVATGIALLTARAGSRAADLVVHCGVAICGDCYQVGKDVAGACGRPADGPTRLDLRAVIAEQARRQGVTRISVSPHCSAHMPDRFFSHRGSGGKAGRMVAFLGIEPSLDREVGR